MFALRMDASTGNAVKDMDAPTNKMKPVLGGSEFVPSLFTSYSQLKAQATPRPKGITMAEMAMGRESFQFLLSSPRSSSMPIRNMNRIRPTLAMTLNVVTEL